MGYLTSYAGQVAGGATASNASVAVPVGATYALMMISARGFDAQTAFSAIQLGGVDFTYDAGTMRRWNGSYGAVAVAYMLAADLPSGTVTATVTRSGTADGMCFVVAFFDGRAQAAPEVIARSAEGALLGVTDVSTNITPLTAGALLVDAVQTIGNAADYTEGAGQTVLLLDTVSGQSNAILTSYKEVAGTSATSMSWTNASSRDHAQIIVSLAPEGGGELAFSAGPSVSAVTSSGFTAGGTASANCTARLVVTNAGAAQPSDGTFDASSETASVTAATPFTIPHTGETGNALRWAWIQLDDGVTRVTDYAPALLPTAGWEMIQLASVNPDSDVRITAVPDLEAGDYLQWNDITGTGTVEVNDDATYDATVTVSAFGVAAGNLTDGWGSVGTQTLNGSVPEASVGGIVRPLSTSLVSQLFRSL